MLLIRKNAIIRKTLLLSIYRKIRHIFKLFKKQKSILRYKLEYVNFSKYKNLLIC